MSRFEEVRALVEENVRKHFGEKALAYAPIDMMASTVVAEFHGMELHDRVNDAAVQAISGKIYKTKEFSIVVQSWLLRGLLREEKTALREITKKMTESVATAVCEGQVSEKARKAFHNPTPGFVQHEVIEAYRRAIRDNGSAPTITDVRSQFLEQNKKALLPKGYSLRKMITVTFRLPLAEGKRGRPRLISNRRRESR